MPGANGQPAVRNVGSAAERVSTAALLAAMELLPRAERPPGRHPADQLLDDIGQAAIRPAELTRAFATLLYGFLQMCNDADVDVIVGSVTRRLRRLQLVPEVMVTRMCGAMDAAAAGQSPLDWREQVGPISPAEGLAVADTAWRWPTWSTTSVRSVVSVTVQRPGGRAAARSGPRTGWRLTPDLKAANRSSRRMRLRWLQERGVTADQVDWPQMSDAPIASFAWHGGASQREKHHQVISYRRLRPLPRYAVIGIGSTPGRGRCRYRLRRCTRALAGKASGLGWGNVSGRGG